MTAMCCGNWAICRGVCFIRTRHSPFVSPLAPAQRQSAVGATMFSSFSTQSSSSCSPISVPRTFSFRSFLFMPPLAAAAAVASDQDVEGETRILLSTRRGQSQWEGVSEGALFLSLSPETLLLPVPCIDFFQPLQSPRNFLGSIFLLQSF